MVLRYFFCKTQSGEVGCQAMARDSADGRLRRQNRRAWTRWESRFRKQVGQLSEICDFRQAADFAVLRCGWVVDLSAKLVQVCRGACDGDGAYIYNNVYGNPCFYIQFLVISAVNNQIERKQPRFVAIRNTYCAFCCNFGAKSGRNPFIYSEVCRYC